MTTPNKDLKQDVLSVITANRFADGRVVWFTEQGSWNVLIEEAKVFHTKTDAEDGQKQTLKDVATQYIIDPYIVEVDIQRVPRSVREQIRASGGPSTHPEFNLRFEQETTSND